ncbi:37239_t:CDS:1, partial [Gigaspora margarita]
LNNKMTRQNRNIILFIDNCSVYKLYSNTILTNIQIHFLPPNTISHLQLYDASIIHSFKAHYRKLFVDDKIEAYDSLGNTTNKIREFTLLDALKLTKKAWEYVTEKTIKNCWKSTGILPSFLSDRTPISPILTTLVNSNISTSSDTVSTNLSTKETNFNNYEIQPTTVVHNHSITSNEGSTTHYKSSKTNIDNTTMIQNNTIIVNQHGNITSIQDSTITKNLVTLYDNEIQFAKQEFSNKNQNELNMIQNSIDQLRFTNPISA